MLEQRNNILSMLLNRSIYCFGRDNYARIFDMLTSECDIGFFQQKILKRQHWIDASRVQNV